VADRYCSVRFKTGEELDKALAAALCSCDDAARAEAAAARAEEIQSKVDETVTEALTQAKESGEFDGPAGKDGEDGYTPQKGVDYWTEADKAEIKAEVGGGGVSSWNDLTEKPFGEEMKSSTTKFAQLPEEHFDAIGYTWWKISDLAPTKEQILETEVNLSIPDIDHYVQWTPVETEFIADTEALSGVLSGTYGIGLLFCREDGEHTAEVSGTAVSVVVPSVGVYFGYNQGQNPPSGLEISISYEGVKTLDAKYLPTDVVRGIVNEVINDALSGEY
jgi:hypothetical protein